MAQDKIIVRGAKEHNLKNVNVEIPRNKLVVITGLSGSGKSSLAFDTIYAEGQRRYVESLSSYARMFLGQMDKPNVESIEGLSPAISIDQKTTSKNPRSTVGTVTEIYDYLRLLYARIGVPHCTVCGREIRQQTVDQIVDKIMTYETGTKIQVMAPVVRGRKGEHAKVLDSAGKSGYVRARVDGIIYDLSENIPIEKNKKHNIEIIVDRLVIKPEIVSRLSDSIETASKLGGGLVMVNFNGDEDVTFSQKYACPEHGVSIDDLSPRMFSFNNPFGACPKCTGLGVFLKIDENKIIPDMSKSIRDGGIKGSGWAMEGSTIAAMYMEALAKKYNFSLDEPLENLPKETIDKILYGTGDDELTINKKSVYGGGTYQHKFEGIINNLERRYRETSSNWIKDEIRSYMAEIPCDLCHGDRLSAESLAVTVGGLNIADFCKMSVVDALDFVGQLKLTEKEQIIGAEIVKEINERLNFLKSVGLGYLTLSRSSGTLSGGESQRINLATSLGSSLVGSLYILDEPSIGLHSRDTDKLIHVLRQLQQLGNTVVVVEHDEEIIRAADYIIDIGPRAGRLGGKVVYQGDMKDLQKDSDSYTVRYLLGEETIPLPEHRRPWNNYIEIKGARENNLKGVEARFPLNVMTVVTGVSGSGKSTLVRDIFYRALKRELDECNERPGEFTSIGGDLQNLRNVEFVDQNPIGKSSRSNPVTYIKAYDEIRKLWADQPLAKQMGYSAGYFSFNSEGGRCEECKGEGTITVEMQFMADLVLECESCHGKRFKADTLEVKFHDMNIYDVLEMTVNQAIEFFTQHGQKKIVKKLQPLQDVGLGYIKLGQASSTLSGGENQRVKLAFYLSQEKADPTMFIFDEPTTGLHFHDIKKLLEAFDALIRRGHSIVIIEHNLDVVKCADHVIDLGPEGGDKGGNIVATGTPEEVAKCAASYTGQFLQEKLPPRFLK